MFALAYHVDFWDDLGWKDLLYAKNDHTRRQSVYATALGGQVATPQMLINGRREYPWYDARRGSSEIAESLAERVETALALTVAVQATEGPLRLTFAVSAAPNGSVLRLALVERGLVTDVKAGGERWHAARPRTRGARPFDPCARRKST